MIVVMARMITVIEIIVIMLTAVGRQAGDQASRSTVSWSLKNIKKYKETLPEAQRTHELTP